MDAVRTPEDHFALLDGFPGTPAWIDDLQGFAEWGEPIARRALEILDTPRP